MARQLVHVDTGLTKSTIRIEDMGLDSEVIADGAALFLELGWHRGSRQIGPFPFLRPAFDMIWPTVPSRIGKYLYLLATGQTLPSKASLGE